MDAFNNGGAIAFYLATSTGTITPYVGNDGVNPTGDDTMTIYADPTVPKVYIMKSVIYIADFTNLAAVVFTRKYYSVSESSSNIIKEGKFISAT